MEYNPRITTHHDEPTAEAVKAASMVTRFMYWMMNESSEQNFINAFGLDLGTHLWHKVQGDRKNNGTFYGDLHFWCELTTWNRNKFMHYLLKTGYKG